MRLNNSTELPLNTTTRWPLPTTRSSLGPLRPPTIFFSPLLYAEVEVGLADRLRRTHLSVWRQAGNVERVGTRERRRDLEDGI